MENIPTWVVYAVGVANILQIFLLIILIIVLAVTATTIISLLKQLQGETLKHVNHTLENVAKMSDDAQATTHNVTSAANRVSNLVGSAATRVESPVIRAVGLASGLIAGARAVRGKGGKTEVVVEKKRRGFLG